MKNSIMDRGDGTAEISLTCGRTALIDASEIPNISKYTWRGNDQGSRVYARAKIGKRQTYLHRLVMSNPVAGVVDHVNGNTLDNRHSNLRVVTCSTNALNRGGPNKGSASGFRGVRRKRQKWLAEIQIRGKRINLGCYSNPVDAGAVVAKFLSDHALSR